MHKMIRGPYKKAGTYTVDLFEKAIKLRKQGYGYRSISHLLDDKVPWPTIRGWMKSIFPIDPRRAYLNAEQFRKHRPAQWDSLRGNTARRNFLIREHGHKCMTCGSIEWMGYKIPLEIHHIDGDKANNRRDNIRLICPNCHAQTDTYCGKNVALVAERQTRTPQECVSNRT